MTNLASSQYTVKYTRTRPSVDQYGGLPQLVCRTEDNLAGLLLPALPACTAHQSPSGSCQPGCFVPTRQRFGKPPQLGLPGRADCVIWRVFVCLYYLVTTVEPMPHYHVFHSQHVRSWVSRPASREIMKQFIIPFLPRWQLETLAHKPARCTTLTGLNWRMLTSRDSNWTSNTTLNRFFG